MQWLHFSFDNKNLTIAFNQRSESLHVSVMSFTIESNGGKSILNYYLITFSIFQ